MGRDIAPDLAEMRHYAWFLIGVAVVALGLGLIGGWWLSERAIRPIADISATAKKISRGDLSQRIESADTDSELGELAGVLNDTFARLQSNFARQAQFTADASHELRTPVAVILTQTQSALNRERSSDEYRESLAACQRAAQRMRQLTESLLALARLDSPESSAARMNCALDRVVKDTVEQLQPLAKGEGIRLELESESVHGFCDPGQIGQVASNLVSNAIHYNRKGGQVWVKIEARGSDAVLTVRDTGEGIDSADLPHVFKRFYRADKARTRAHGRTGLGLAITQAVVTAHGGSLEVESEVGKGSVFTVRLPMRGDV